MPRMTAPPTSDVRMCVRPSTSIISSTIGWACSRVCTRELKSRHENMTLSSTERSSYMTSSCGTKPIPRLSAERSWMRMPLTAGATDRPLELSGG